jgi:Flp pilus assembly protein TadG
MKRNSEPSGRPARDPQRGQALVFFALLLVVLLSAAAFVVDIGDLYFSYQELQGATNSAALAGGAAITAGTAQNTAYEYSGDPNSPANATYNIHSNLNITGVTVTFGCISTATYPNLGLPPCSTYGSQPSANAIQVVETASVGTYFAKIFGVSSVNVTATATASAKGGISQPYHVMLVLDTTASMGSGTDSGCTVPGVSGSPTPEQCAQYGVQQLLGELDPCSTALTSCGAASNGVVNNAVDQVGLMVFPGLCSDALSNGSCPTSTATSPTYATGTGASNDYQCPATNPVTTPYNNNPAYLILPLQSDYRSSDTASISTGTSGANIVKAVGAGVGTCPGVGTPGGQGTFYAGVLSQAQAYLTANSTANVQNIIVLLSDGDATASAQQMSGSTTSFSATAECQQAVTAAANAKGTANPYTPGLNTLIYSVSYGSETSGCTAGDTLTPCGTMSAIASLPTSEYFFSVPQTINGVNSTVCSGARPDTSLNQVFTDIASDLTNSRLLPNGVF